MARLDLPALQDMTPEQRAVHDEAVSGRRGHAPAPLTAWIRNPEFARRAQKLGELLRYDTSLPPNLSELAILVMARHWTSHYEWKVHKQEALKAGVSETAIAAIAARTTPSFASDTEQLVFDISTSLLQTHIVPQPLYRRGLTLLGERGLVDLIGVLGYYGMVSMTLNTFEIGLTTAYQAELGDGGV